MNTSLLCAAEIASRLHHSHRDVPIYIYDSLASTNITARELAHAGAVHGTVVIAEEQTAGRGRFSRPFLSPKATGLYMSIILHPAEMQLDTPTMITLKAAVEVCEAIEALCPLHPRIKWVNDILINRKKAGGISCETVSSAGNVIMPWVILGIGINVCTPQEYFPLELQQLVTSLYPREDAPFTRNELAAEILNRMLCGLECSTGSPLISSYRSRLMLGMRVTVSGQENEYEALAVDVDDTGGLIVHKDDGTQTVLTAGEISTRLRWGS